MPFHSERDENRHSLLAALGIPAIQNSHLHKLVAFLDLIDIRR